MANFRLPVLAMASVFSNASALKFRLSNKLSAACFGRLCGKAAPKRSDATQAITAEAITAEASPQQIRVAKVLCVEKTLKELEEQMDLWLSTGKVAIVGLVSSRIYAQRGEQVDKCLKAEGLPEKTAYSLSLDFSFALEDMRAEYLHKETVRADMAALPEWQRSAHSELGEETGMSDRWSTHVHPLTGPRMQQGPFVPAAAPQDHHSVLPAPQDHHSGHAETRVQGAQLGWLPGTAKGGFFPGASQAFTAKRQELGFY